MDLLIGLDVGTTSVKAGLFDASGACLAVAGEEYRLDHPAPDRAELDADTYWRASVAAVRRMMAAPGVERDAVVALAISSQGETVVPVDGAGKPLAPAIVWLDNRATAESRVLAAAFADQRVYDVTGVPSVVPTWPACKILWWRRHAPDVFADTRRFLLVEDLLLHRLTGRFVTEGGVQCTSLLFDIRSNAWWDEMLEAVGIDASRLPELARPGDTVGTLTREAAEALGLSTRVRVVAGGMDQGAGAVGVGNVRAGMVSESTGGALTLQASVATLGADPTRQTPIYVHSAPGMYLYCPVCPTGGMALTWFRDQFGGEETALAGRGGPGVYDLLTALAAEVSPGSEGLIMLPHLMGAFSPEYEPEARGVYFGFTLRHGKGHFVRAVLEAVAFMLRRNVELLERAGASAPEIRSHGGGARSDLWNQVKADVCGRPVLTLEGDDAAIRGDAMQAGVATGIYPDLDAAARAMVTTRRRYDPDPGAQAVYNEAYGRYIELFDALRPVFRRPGSA
ncbi:MAG: FGGY family carbohydrate kinase [Chloroflexi bacterium]|nr:FGGY family carbohydrate kinase [Chloroflexota bacterium]